MSVRTGRCKRVDWEENEGCDDCRALGACGRDELNDNGKRLLTFASDSELALTNTEYLIRSTPSSAIMTENG